MTDLVLFSTASPHTLTIRI